MRSSWSRWAVSFVSLFVIVIWSSAQATGASVQFFHPDHLGSTLLTTDLQAQVVEGNSYTPFGETSSGIQTTPNVSRFQYANQELDPESNLYNYGARYYDPALAHFISRDPVLSEPPYAYVRNNPLISVDPDGREFRLLNQNARHVDDGVALLQELVGNEATVRSTPYLNGVYSAISLTNIVENPGLATQILKRLIENPKRIDGFFLLSEDKNLPHLLETRYHQHFIAKVVPQSEYHCTGQCDDVVYFKDFDFQQGKYSGDRPELSETWALAHELVHLFLRGLPSPDLEVAALLDKTSANGQPKGASMGEAIATTVANRMFPGRSPVEYYLRKGDMNFSDADRQREFDQRVAEAINLITNPTPE